MSSVSDSENLVAEIKNHMSKIQSLSEEEIKDRIDSGKGMIEFFTKLTSDVETRRMRLADNNFTRISLGLVAIGIVVNFKLQLIFTLLLVLAIVTIIIPSIAVLIEYNNQSKFRYPWSQDSKGITNQWNWFYYGNPSLNEINYVTDKKFESENWNKYQKGLIYFVDRTIESTSYQKLESILYQQYLLQAHNGFKNKFYLELLNTEAWWSTTALKFAGIAATLFLILNFYRVI